MLRGARTALASRSALVLLGIGIAVGFGIGAVYSGQSGAPAAPDAAPQETAAAPERLSGDVQIGFLSTVTGDLSSFGFDTVEAARLAEGDFNAYLAEVRAPWRLDVVVEDTQTSPVVALEKVQSLKARGIDIAGGPLTSSELSHSLNYANNNDMILFSPSSTSADLAIAGDSAFRLAPDDSNQSPALARLLSESGVGVMIPVWRGDTWGDGLAENISRIFAESGGIVDEGIRYNPETTTFSSAASLLSERVEAHAAEHGAGSVGIMLICFAEGFLFMQEAAGYDSLAGVRWFTADGMTKDEALFDDPARVEFANAARLVGMQFASQANPVRADVEERLAAAINYEPNSYAYSAYDVVWLLGLSMLASDSDSASEVERVLPHVAAKYIGAGGPGALNDAGDRAFADYSVWEVDGEEWVNTATYTRADDSVHYRSQAS